MPERKDRMNLKMKLATGEEISLAEFGYNHIVVLCEDLEAFRAVEDKVMEEGALSSVEVTDDGHGKASADPSKAVGGTEIALSATSDEGYAFDKWTSENEVTFADPEVLILHSACRLRM